MRFSLLKPPEDAPSRIPLSRGLPSAEALSVSTSGLPRALPMPTVDPDSFAAPYQALARLGAQGLQVSDSVGNMLLEAEARKRNADNLAVATNLEYKASLGFDDALEKAKTSTDNFSFKPTVDDAWKQISQDTMAQAPNAEVARMLGLRLEGLKAHKYPEVNNTQRVKQSAYYEATLTTASQSAAKLITDPATTDVDRDFMVKNIKSLYFGYVQQGMISPDTALRYEERYLTSAYNTLAEQAMTADPQGFRPKSEGGNDGYRKFMEGGRGSDLPSYPADPKYLQHLVDTVAPARQEAADRRKIEEDKRREAYGDAHLKRAWQDNFTGLLKDFYSDDPNRVADASGRLDEAMTGAQEYWTPGEREILLKARRDTSRQGGVTMPAVFDKLQTDLLRDASSVSRDTILGWAGKGLAVTGPYSVTALLDKREQLLKEDDISQRADYKIGLKVLDASPVGGAAIMSVASAYNPNIKAADVIWHGDLLSKAIAEYDRLARSPEWGNKSLRELGEMLAAKYSAIMKGGRRGGSGIQAPPENQ